MKIFLTCCIMFVSVNVFAQELDGVYFKNYKRHIYIYKAIPRLSHKRYVYAYLNTENFSMIYIDTALRWGGKIQFAQENYRMVGDSIFFKNYREPGILKNDKLYIPSFAWEQLEKAKLSDVEEFIEKYGDEFRSSNICFQNGYAIPCRE